jgi:hypothetical protein
MALISCILVPGGVWSGKEACSVGSGSGYCRCRCLVVCVRLLSNVSSTWRRVASICSAVRQIEIARVESSSRVNGSHEMVSPSRKKRRVRLSTSRVVWSQRVAIPNNLLWMGGGDRVGGWAGVERGQVESLITCRLDVVGGWPDGEGEDIVGSPGGRPESAHRLRLPMVKVPMGSVGYVGTSTGVCSSVTRTMCIHYHRIVVHTLHPIFF